ncbi:MAG: DUF4924 family protein [Crocinitomicaceae bacterium]
MRIAEKKYQENIAEYILYMYQIIDIIRANNLDIEQIQNTVISESADDEDFDAYTKWYNGLILKMKDQNIEKKGILDELSELQMELFYLHNTLLAVLKDKKYQEYFSKAEEAIEDFQRKSNSPNLNVIEVCFNALYFNLLMNLKGMEITEGTKTAFDSIRIVIAYLAKEYKDMRESKGKFSMNAN